jgi:hypothetical protein
LIASGIASELHQTARCVRARARAAAISINSPHSLPPAASARPPSTPRLPRSQFAHARL